MNYFVISNNGDKVENLSKKELLERLEPDEDGYCYYGESDRVTFIDDLNETDTDYWGSDILIIKGEIIKPKIKTIEIFDID